MIFTLASLAATGYSMYQKKRAMDRSGLDMRRQQAAEETAPDVNATTDSQGFFDSLSSGISSLGGGLTSIFSSLTSVGTGAVDTAFGSVSRGVGGVASGVAGTITPVTALATTILGGANQMMGEAVPLVRGASQAYIDYSMAKYVGENPGAYMRAAARAKAGQQTQQTPTGVGSIDWGTVLRLGAIGLGGALLIRMATK